MITIREKGYHICNIFSKKYKLVTSLLIAIFCCIALSTALIAVLTVKYDSNLCKVETNNLTQQHLYLHAAVASDAGPCASIANNIMMVKGGNAVDGALSGMICDCAVNFHSCGIGGGGFVVIYIKKDQKVYAIDIREQAPASAHTTMFVNDLNSALIGGKSIAVMGLISGYYEIHQKFGKISWKILFQPTIDLLKTGFYVSRSLENAIDYFVSKRNGTQFQELWSIIGDLDSGKPKRFGDIIRIPKLSNTLSILANEPHAMRNGSLVNAVIKEINSAGGIINRRDLAQYNVTWRTPISVSLAGGDVLHTLPPPSSGVLVAFILNVLDQYSFDSSDFDTCDRKALFFHRFIEVMKFAYAKRSILGDMTFENVAQVMENLMSTKYAKWIKNLIHDDRTHPFDYYQSNFAVKEDHGTSHFSLISPDGDAVSATSTINYLFGSLVMGAETGILYNDEMDDFSIPNKPNIYNIHPSPINFIKAGKRPMSSMSPIIVVDKIGDVKLVTGASGGIQIISSTALVSALTILLNREIKESIDHPRVHNQLLPQYTLVESNFPNDVLRQLQKLGHKIVINQKLATVQGVHISNRDLAYIECNADFRKMGMCSGF